MDEIQAGDEAMLNEAMIGALDAQTAEHIKDCRALLHINNVAVIPELMLVEEPAGRKLDG